MTARMFQPGETLPGTKYRVVRQLGAGGMGVVYQVQKPPQIGGVLKIMAADLAAHEEFRTRFFDEVRVLAQLDHPNIVRVFDYDALADGTPYYVMEMLHGRTVREVLDSVGRVPPRVAFEVTRQLLEALHCAHTNAIPVVHRDIKPENIFLHAPRHGDPVVKLIDFGVVAVADRAHDGTFVGTWKYAAPEQIRGERATPATDLYAVGLVLYEMLGGAGPFDRYETGPAVAHAHVREQPAPVSLLAPWVPASIVQLIASALAKDPRQRPRDAYDFAEKLFELEWASDGKDPRDATREGRLGPGAAEAREGVAAGPAIARVLTDVGIPARGEAPSSGDVASAGAAGRHRGPTRPGLGDTSSEPPPDDDDLLAGLSARDPNEPRAPGRTPRSPGVVVDAGARGTGAVAPPSSRPIHEAVTLDAPPTTPPPRAPETDTFAASQTDPHARSRRRAPRRDVVARVVLPVLAVVTAATVVLAVVLVVRRRAELAGAATNVSTTRVVAWEPEAGVSAEAGAGVNAEVDAGANAGANASANANANVNAAASGARAPGTPGRRPGAPAVTAPSAAPTSTATGATGAPKPSASATPRQDLLRSL